MRAQRGRGWKLGAVVAAAAGLLAGSSEPGAPEQAAGTAPARAPAPACRAEPDPADVAAVSAMIEALRRLPPRRTPDGEAVVTLDNRGYGYAPARGPFDLPTSPAR